MDAENFDISDPGGGVRIAGFAGSVNADAGTVLTADGDGGTAWLGPAAAVVTDVLVLSLNSNPTWPGLGGYTWQLTDVNTTDYRRGTDLEAAADGDGNLIVTTVAGGDFGACLVLGYQLTADVGNLDERVLTFTIDSDDTSPGLDLTVPAPGGVGLGASGSSFPFWAVAAAGQACPKISVASANGSADDSYATSGGQLLVWKLGPLA